MWKNYNPQWHLQHKHTAYWYVQYKYTFLGRLEEIYFVMAPASEIHTHYKYTAPNIFNWNTPVTEIRTPMALV